MNPPTIAINLKDEGLEVRGSELRWENTQAGGSTVADGIGHYSKASTSKTQYDTLNFTVSSACLS